MANVMTVVLLLALGAFVWQVTELLPIGLLSQIAVGLTVGEHSDRRWGDRYGEGMMAGKRAMLVVTAGGWPEHYSERGINGQIDDLLFPINHGILFYPGFTVLPPFVAYRVDRLDDTRFRTMAGELRERMRTLQTTLPVPYRKQNGGEYQIPTMELKPGLETPGAVHFALHVAEPKLR